MNNNKKYPEVWEDYSREDLKIHTAMGSLGWYPQYSWNDEKIKRITVSNPPHFPVNYSRGDERLWLCRQGWRLAKLSKGGIYYDHKWVNIEDVLNDKY